MLIDRLPFLAGLLAACALLLAPAAAQAAPKIQTATFSVSAKVSQTTTWRTTPVAGASECVGITWVRGEGRETVKATLRPWRFSATRIGSALTLSPAVRANGTGAIAPAKVERRAREEVIEVGRLCNDTPQTVKELGPYDCGRRDRPMALGLNWVRGRLSVSLVESTVLPLDRVDFDDCPIRIAGKVQPNGLTAISEALPAGELMSPRLRQHIVIAKRTFKLQERGYTGTTTVRWEVKLTRTGKR